MDQNLLGFIVFVTVVVVGQIVRHIIKKKLDIIEGVSEIHKKGDKQNNIIIK